MIELDKKMIKTDIDGHLDKDSEITLRNHLKNIGKILSVFGFNSETNQVVFKITAFNNLPACQKVSPILNSIISIIEPVQVNLKIKSKFRALAIVDRKRGYSGRHTLLINSKNEYAILKEKGEELLMIESFGKLKTLDQVLIYISKYLFYY